MTRRNANPSTFLSRRTLLKGIGWAPILLRPAALFGSAAFSSSTGIPLEGKPAFGFSDVRLAPHYPLESPLADIFRRVPPGSDEYITEKYAIEIEAILRRWSRDLLASPQNTGNIAEFLSPSLLAGSLSPARRTKVRSSFGVDVEHRSFNSDLSLGRDAFIDNMRTWLGSVDRIPTAEFEIYRIEQIPNDPLIVRVAIRYDLVLDERSDRRTRRFLADGVGAGIAADLESPPMGNQQRGDFEHAARSCFRRHHRPCPRHKRLVQEAIAPRCRLLAHGSGRCHRRRRLLQQRRGRGRLRQRRLRRSLHLPARRAYPTASIAIAGTAPLRT